MEDQNEGLVLWCEALKNSRPSNWARLMNDFRTQLDVMETDFKNLRRSADAMHEAAEANALAAEKMSYSASVMAKHEKEYGDGTTCENPNKDGRNALSTYNSINVVYDALHTAALAQPSNIEYLLRICIKYQLNQIDAFRKYLKLWEDQNNEVLKQTKKLDGFLTAKMEGREVKRQSMTWGSSSKESSDEIIAKEQVKLEELTEILDYRTSALEFSEVDRFNFNRTAYLKRTMALLGASQTQLAHEHTRMWSKCVDQMQYPMHLAVERMEVVVPMMATLKHVVAASGVSVDRQPQTAQILPIPVADVQVAEPQVLPSPPERLSSAEAEDILSV
eukprot:CAMPEP_0185763158 /NCGR_PEP_ID=MMETSP1174-20130828/22119_1 /TAXON_ID=35687 /ORGANISM="Dictyocha speculum, Strain CCMP1381" /LENGTH=332 /DNA_ID=CAMNT_0028445161 /DNA_START=69 /DNA_END=1067 /DNA_ORIENTATION=-